MVWLDAEQYPRQPAMNYIARRLSNIFNKNGEIIVFNTYQMYLNDAKDWLKFDMDYAKLNGYSMGVKLVRGAYLVTETDDAKDLGIHNPIHQTKVLCFV